MSLGSNLSDARKKKSLSQEAVAEKLGVSRQTISKWETELIQLSTACWAASAVPVNIVPLWHTVNK